MRKFVLNRLFLWGAFTLLVLVGIGIWVKQKSEPLPVYRVAKVERGALTASVSATGTVNPVTSVQVGTQVSGQIKELFVDFNSTVKRGQLVARIDPETFTYRVRQAEADMEAARSAVMRAQVSQVNAKRDLDRTQELVKRNFVSPAEVDSRQSAFDLATAELRTAQATVQQREAQLAAAQVDLGRTEIRAPVDGVVIKRSVDVGQTVAASLQAPELLVIARDLHDMQVETSIDEADVGRIKPGQAATFTVDAFPGRSFTGKVSQVRKSPTNVQNVITYTVLVTAANADLLLLPGMTANVRIVTDTRESVLKVANAALRFRPPSEISGSSNVPKPRSNVNANPAASRVHASGAAAHNRARLWTLVDGKLQPIEVRTGLSDGTATEVEGEGVTEGLEVITGIAATGESDRPPQKGGPPRMMF